MASNPSDQPIGSVPSGLSRSVSEATERIHEIIDAAEKVASEIRTEAETEAQKYLAERRREADRAAEERTESLDRLTKTVADIGEQFKHQAERMIAELDRAITDARAGVYRNGAIAALGDEPAEAPLPEPAPEPTGGSGRPVRDLEPPAPDRDPFDSLSSEPREREPFERESLSPLGPDDDPIELPPLDREPVERSALAAAAVSAYPGSADTSASERAPDGGRRPDLRGAAARDPARGHGQGPRGDRRRPARRLPRRRRRAAARRDPRLASRVLPDPVARREQAHLAELREHGPALSGAVERVAGGQHEPLVADVVDDLDLARARRSRASRPRR